MTAQLGYTYCTGLSDQEIADIDNETQKFREEFSRGFLKGASLCLAGYSLYSLIVSPVWAADSNITTGGNVTPVGDSGGISQPTAPAVPVTKPPIIVGVSTAIGAVAGNSSVGFRTGLIVAVVLVGGTTYLVYRKTPKP